ncbi:MAG: UvrD-helicase domain-containing protein [Planctomycetota bacterium]
MSIARAIEQHYPGLNDAQRAIVGHLDGPLLVIAGPGSGKTYSIVLRALNLLLLETAQPRQLVLCTFTEKAAFEMRDRLAAAARKVGYTGDLSELAVSTIHSFCNRVLTQHRHRTELGHSFDTLDELTQLLFIFEHFDQILGPPENDLFLGKWKTRWTAIEGARGYFDKITEELVDSERLTASADPFLAAIGSAYRRYERALLDANRTDFAHLQRLVYDLLGDPTPADAVTRDLRYVLVDEYQDTNYIPAFCPRARAYFEIPEVRDLVACFAVLFGWHGNGRGEAHGAVAELATYVDDAIVQLARRFGVPHPLAEALQRWTGEIAVLQDGEALDLRPADYFYHLLGLDPFKSAVKSENTARNLAIFSQLLNLFQSYYHYTVVTHRNREFLRFHFFNSFLRLLYDGGINEYEDPDQPFPRGHVRVMTIHQAKGLEFPVVVVGSLSSGDGKLELLDFKTSPRPKDSPELIAAYERQLCTYAHILERRHGRHVDRLLLYWTSEARKEYALMVLPYDTARVEEAGRHFDDTVRRIQAREFAVTTPPEAGICKECNLKMLCHAEGVIGREAAPA